MKKFSDIISKLINKLGRFLDKYGTAAFIIFWFVFVMSCFFIWGYIEVHAAADQDYFPMHQNTNGKITQYVIDYIDNNFDHENNYIATGTIQVVGNYTSVYILVVPKSSNMIYAEKFNNLYQFSYYMATNTNGSYKVYEVKYRTSNPSNVFHNDYTTSGLTYFQNLYSSNYDTNSSYVSNLKIWTNNNPSTRQLVLNYGYLEPDYNYTGHAIPPNLDSPEYPTGATIPDRVPQFHTWNSYTWNTYNPPTFDTSTLESMIESLGDIVKYNAEYIADGIGGVIENLGNNLKNYIEDLGNIIKYYGDLISGNIKDFATNIYDNIKEILEPIQSVVDLFVKPWDSNEFEQQLGESAFYGSLDSTITNIRSFGTSLTRATEPQDLSLTIDLTAIGWGTSEISFNWLKPSSIRTVIRLIIGCVLVYWLVITVITELNNIIGSGGDSEQ